MKNLIFFAIMLQVGPINHAGDKLYYIQDNPFTFNSLLLFVFCQVSKYFKDLVVLEQ